MYDKRKLISELSKNEQAVLKALADLRYPKEIATTARKAGLKRTTTHYILHRLEKMRLVQHVTWLDGRRTGLAKRLRWFCPVNIRKFL